MLRAPPPVRPGDRVRIIAPGGVTDRTQFDAGLALLEAVGLSPVFDPRAVFARSHYFAGDDAARLSAFEEALQDSSASVLWAARGGYGASRLVPHLVLDKIRAAGKWLVGFSDVTVLHCLWARAGLASVHGANVTTLPSWPAEARSELFGWLFSGGEAVLTGRTVQGERAAHGVLLGGNITVLASLAGTGALASWQGTIVFLEDIGERPYRLDRSLTQLKQAGAFAGVAGLVIGQLTACEEPNGSASDYKALDAVCDTLADFGVPILAELPVGHEPSSRAVPFGAAATLDPRAGALTVRLNVHARA